MDHPWVIEFNRGGNFGRAALRAGVGPVHLHQHGSWLGVVPAAANPVGTDDGTVESVAVEQCAGQPAAHSDASGTQHGAIMVIASLRARGEGIVATAFTLPASRRRIRRRAMGRARPVEHRGGSVQAAMEELPRVGRALLGGRGGQHPLHDGRLARAASPSRSSTLAAWRAKSAESAILEPAFQNRQRGVGSAQPGQGFGGGDLHRRATYRPAAAATPARPARPSRRASCSPARPTSGSLRRDRPAPRSASAGWPDRAAKARLARSKTRSMG